MASLGLTRKKLVLMMTLKKMVNLFKFFCNEYLYDTIFLISIKKTREHQIHLKKNRLEDITTFKFYWIHFQKTSLKGQAWKIA